MRVHHQCNPCKVCCSKATEVSYLALLPNLRERTSPHPLLSWRDKAGHSKTRWFAVVRLVSPSLLISFRGGGGGRGQLIIIFFKKNRI